MRKLIFLLVPCIILVSLLSLLGASAAYVPPFEMYGQGVYMVNTDKDKVIYEREKDKQFQPASLTKIMTAIIALETVEDLETTVTAPSYIFDELYGLNASNAGIMHGEIVTMKDLLYGLMLPSACEAASIIADYIGEGSIPAFVEKMNAKAAELGATNTHFVNAHGLDTEGQASTAYDMYLITSYAMKNPVFAEISTTSSYVMAATNKHPQERTILHTNGMLRKGASDYYYEYAKGIKTGTSNDYKNLVSIASKDGNSYMVIVLGAPTNTKAGLQATYSDTRQLYQWAFSNFGVRTVAEAGVKLIPNNVKVELGKDVDTVVLTPNKDVFELLPNDVDVSTVMWDTSRLPQAIKAPITKGDIIGEVDLKLKDEVVRTVTVVANEDIERSQWLYIGSMIKNVVTSWWFIILVGLFLILLIAYFIIVVAYNRRRKKKYQNGSKRNQ